LTVASAAEMALLKVFAAVILAEEALPLTWAAMAGAA
jgi:hypothetical protein